MYYFCFCNLIVLFFFIIFASKVQIVFAKSISKSVDLEKRQISPRMHYLWTDNTILPQYYTTCVQIEQRLPQDWIKCSQAVQYYDGDCIKCPQVVQYCCEIASSVNKQCNIATRLYQVSTSSTILRRDCIKCPQAVQYCGSRCSICTQVV